jgi:hypothetical protein
LFTLVIAFFRIFKKKIVQDFEANYSIRLIRGDILEGSQNAVIGFSDTFQVRINDPIAPSSLQGQFLSRIWNGDEDDLEVQVNFALKKKTSLAEVTDSRVTRFPIGTTVCLEKAGRKFFLVAYSTMDVFGQASATAPGLTSALYELWDQVRVKSNFEPISIPLVGQGLARLNVLTPDAALRLLSLTFVLAANQSKVCAGLNIVIRAEDWNKIDRIGFKQFLKTLPGAI